MATVNAELGLCFSTDPRQPSTVRYICLFTAGGFNAADSHRPVPANHYAHLTKASGDGTRLLWSLTNQTTDTPTGEIRLESITVEKKWTVTLKELRRFPGTVACFEPKGQRAYCERQIVGAFMRKACRSRLLCSSVRPPKLPASPFRPKAIGSRRRSAAGPFTYGIERTGN